MSDILKHGVERSGKAPLEIERKFLVDTSRLDTLGSLEDYEHSSIRQGYLVIGADGSEARVRDKGGKYTVTVKTKGELVRGEWETSLTQEQFEALWGASEGQRVEKTRFQIPHGEFVVELDVYEGALEGLVTAEIEFENEVAAGRFVSPEWLSADVTSDEKYKNQNLAQGGFMNDWRHSTHR